MPEGPEVRRCRDVVADVILGERISILAPVSGKLMRTGIKGADDLKTATNSFLVTDVRVKGKVIFIHLEDGRVIISTLGMSGWWYPSSNQLTPEQSRAMAHYANQEVRVADVINVAEKYTRASIFTTSGRILNYSDMRNFGNMYVADAAEAAKKLASLGPDLLNEQVSLEVWLTTWRKPKLAKSTIGEALLEQSVFCGLGNIYRAETCFLAGVSPFTLVGGLTDSELERLLASATYILKMAYETQGAVEYSIPAIKTILEPHRYEQLKDRVTKLFSESWDAIETRAVHRSFLCYGQTVTPMGEAVQRTTLGSRTMWHVS